MKKSLSIRKTPPSDRTKGPGTPVMDRILYGLIIVLGLLIFISIPDILGWFGVKYPLAFLYSGCNSLSINAGYALRLMIAGGFLLVTAGLAVVVYFIDKPDKGFVSKPHLILIVVAAISVVCAIAIKPNCG